MKNILCPVSSPRPGGLIKYIGSMAHDTHAKVFLASLQASRQKVYAISGTHISEEAKPSGLDETSKFLTATMHVDCGIEQEILDGSPYKKLSQMANAHDMIAVPLYPEGGSTDVVKLDLTKVINETRVPILLVPESFQYKKIKCLIYAYDYKHEPEPPLTKLSQLASWFSADVRFMSVFSRDSLTKERDKVHELHIKLLKAWKGGNKISFDTIVYPQIPKFEEQYIGQPEQGDLQVLSVSHQSFLDRLLRRGLVEGVQHSKYPYVIIHQ
jgi:hypothetical protein